MSNELAQDDGLIQEFVTESEEQLQVMERDLLGLENASDVETVNRVFRAMHTVKGTSSFLGFDPLVELSHHAEDILNLIRKGEASPTKAITNVLLLVCDQIRKMLRDIAEHRELHYDNQPLIEQMRTARLDEQPPKLGEILAGQPVVHPADLQDALQEAQSSGEKLGQVLIERGLATPLQVEQALTKQGVVAGVAEHATMRVEVRKLDCLVNLVGELVLERNRLAQLSREFSTNQITPEQLDSALGLSTTRLSFITEELQTASLDTRMVQIEAVFRRLPRMVRDVSRTLGKEVRLEIVGQETEIDKTMVEEISDPLVHLVRNALDHGIESAEARRAVGKPAEGKLTIEAKPEGDQIVVSVSDDGKGIDTGRVVAKAIEKGFITAERARMLSEREALDLIFVAGMSTAEKVNNVSGRGVGMDVVRSNVKKLNGTVELESKPGKGTTIRIRVPLTMAILPVLLVEASEEVYALPLRSVQETLRVTASQIHSIERQEVLCLADRSIPLLRLSEVLDSPSEEGPHRGGKAVVIAIGDTRIALLVDKLIGQESTVIKAMGDFLKDSPTIAGATISGDGRVRLVLDPASLINTAISLETTRAS
jgi:two-component system chemotaxis sensor kinase CheA